LRGANLYRANFTDADLAAVDLTGSVQTHLCVVGAKLNDIKGLEKRP
jgi:uncharacterized protein YjbI with pentapeptide repeats